jgi:hypothetical protein
MNSLDEEESSERKRRWKREAGSMYLYLYLVLFLYSYFYIHSIRNQVIHWLVGDIKHVKNEGEEEPIHPLLESLPLGLVRG